LETLQLDSVIYQAWWQALRQDWLEGSSGVAGGVSHSSNTSLLQSTLFMWQDLQVLPHMLQSLQADLEVFFTQLAYQHHQQPYRPDRFISYVYQKWMHVSYQWTFLPRTWIRTLIEVHLLQPHLTTEWLLHSDNVTMLLEEDEHNQTDLTIATPMSTSLTVEDAAATTAIVIATAASSISSRTPSSPHWVQLWMLAGRLPEGHKTMTTALCNYTKTKGLAIVNQAFTSPAAAKTMIGNLLVLQRRMAKWQQRLAQVTSTAASNNSGTTTTTSSPSAIDALKHVWEDIVNVAHGNNSQMVAEGLAKYMDPLMRSTKMELESNTAAGAGTGTTAMTINSNHEHPTVYQIQQQILQLFVYLQGKDVFEAFYKKDLAKRLLWNRVVSMDVERHFVTLLKTECGAGYTSKMEGMFADVELSRETMNRYKQQQAPPPATASPNQASSVDMEVQVLTTGYWPVYPQLPHLILPESLLAPQEQFASYYRDKYQGRRITWQYALGHVLVRGNYAASAASGHKGSSATSARQYEFVVSLCQALVLLQFNLGDDGSVKRWTLPQLQRAIGVEDRDEMERILQSLSLGKDGTRVLRKLDHDAGLVAVVPSPPPAAGAITQAAVAPAPPPMASPAAGRAKKIRMNVDDKDVFIVDEKFRSQQRRIRINNILWKETMEEREKIVESVSRDRLYLIDAVLVRVLKARKTITHPQLMQQVMEQVKVPAQASDIKKRIESLIEREYMERDAEDRNRYNYLA
jgi:cullin-4